MGFTIASVLSLLLFLLSLLFHLALAAGIVVLFIQYLNAKEEGQKKKYLALMILLAILLMVMLILRPIMLLLGWSTLL